MCLERDVAVTGILCVCTGVRGRCVCYTCPSTNDGPGKSPGGPRHIHPRVSVRTGYVSTLRGVHVHRHEHVCVCLCVLGRVRARSVSTVPVHFSLDQGYRLGL